MTSLEFSQADADLRSGTTSLDETAPVIDLLGLVPAQRRRARFNPKKPVVAGDGDPRHGRPSTYTNYGCHCDKCSAAKRDDERRRRADRISRGLPEGDPRHGRASGYSNYGCHCDRCVAANTAETRARRGYTAREESSVEATQAIERIQRRMEAGESIKQIAQTAGLSFSTVNNILNGKTKRVLNRTLEAL